MLDALNKQKALKRGQRAAPRTITTLLCTEDDNICGTPPAPVPASPIVMARDAGARRELGWLDADVRTLAADVLQAQRPPFMGDMEYLQRVLISLHKDADVLQQVLLGPNSTAPFVLVIETTAPVRCVQLLDSGDAARAMDRQLMHRNHDERPVIRRVWPASLHKWLSHLSPVGATPFDQHPTLTLRMSDDFVAPFFWDGEFESALEAAPYAINDKRTVSRMMENWAVRYFRLTRPNTDDVNQAINERLPSIVEQRRQQLDDKYQRRKRRHKARLAERQRALDARERELVARQKHTEEGIKRRYQEVDEDIARRQAEADEGIALRRAQAEEHAAARLAEGEAALEERRRRLEERADTLMAGYAARFERSRAAVLSETEARLQHAKAALAADIAQKADQLADAQARLAAYHEYLLEYHRVLGDKEQQQQEQQQQEQRQQEQQQQEQRQQEQQYQHQHQYQQQQRCTMLPSDAHAAIDCPGATLDDIVMPFNDDVLNSYLLSDSAVATLFEGTGFALPHAYGSPMATAGDALAS